MHKQFSIVQNSEFNYNPIQYRLQNSTPKNREQVHHSILYSTDTNFIRVHIRLEYIYNSLVHSTLHSG